MTFGQWATLNLTNPTLLKYKLDFQDYWEDCWFGLIKNEFPIDPMDGFPELFSDIRSIVYNKLINQEVRNAQWDAFNKVLYWINEQDTKMISKGDLYDSVMKMRSE